MGNLAQPCNSHYASDVAQEIRCWETIEDGLFFKKPWSADPQVSLAKLYQLQCPQM
jgi:hypothetical protein